MQLNFDIESFIKVLYLLTQISHLQNSNKKQNMAREKKLTGTVKGLQINFQMKIEGIWKANKEVR